MASLPLPADRHTGVCTASSSQSSRGSCAFRTFQIRASESPTPASPERPAQKSNTPSQIDTASAASLCCPAAIMHGAHSCVHSMHVPALPSSVRV